MVHNGEQLLKIQVTNSMRLQNKLGIHFLVVYNELVL
jgi:hypothetical protein